jgi:hypothetical protein
MMMTLTPLVIRASTLAFSLAESPSLKRISTSYPAALNASLKRVSSWIHRGSFRVGKHDPDSQGLLRGLGSRRGAAASGKHRGGDHQNSHQAVPHSLRHTLLLDRIDLNGVDRMKFVSVASLPSPVRDGPEIELPFVNRTALVKVG